MRKYQYPGTDLSTVVGNDAGLVINPLTRDQLNKASVISTGSIGDPIDDCVFVNGMQATVYDDGSWEAEGVPVSPTGTAVLLVQVYVGDRFANPVSTATGHGHAHELFQ